MPDPSLDDALLYERLDPHGLHDRIAGLPDQIEEAVAAANGLQLPGEYASAGAVVVAGMGGSGIGGLLLQGLAAASGSRHAVYVIRGYELPAAIDARALVIVSSNSGDTEETVAAFAQAIDRGLRCVAITAGGKVARMAEAAGVPRLPVSWSHEPRAALGWSFAAPLAICTRLGLVPVAASELADAVKETRSYVRELSREAPEPANTAKQVARRIAGRLPVFVGAEAFAAVAYRWKTQVNENGKSWAVAEEIPEMNHNSPVGYGLPQRIVPLLHAVLLRHASLHPRNALRCEATRDQLVRAGVSAEIVEVGGVALLSQILRGVLLGDLVSYYLGLLNGVAPSPVDALVELKQTLASGQ
jgi:glucose/mannose-6-phosphate isomerase